MRCRVASALEEIVDWMGARAVEGTGLENRQGFTLLVGSNPTPSAMLLNPAAGVRFFISQ